MNLIFIKEKDLKELKANLDFYCKFFLDDTNNNLVKELNQDLLVQSKLKTGKELEQMFEEGKFPDVENDFEYSKLLYENLKNLSDSQASDERLWAGLSIGPFWNYVQKRWNLKETNNLVTSVKDHYLFGYGPRRSLIRNAISRLWWIARLTYDEQSQDHYHLTKFICSNSRYIGDILERNFSNNPNIIQPFLLAIKDGQDKYIISTDNVRKLALYIDQIGGSFLLDCLAPTTIQKKISDKIYDMYKQNIITAR